MEAAFLSVRTEHPQLLLRSNKVQWQTSSPGNELFPWFPGSRSYWHIPSLSWMHWWHLLKFCPQLLKGLIAFNKHWFLGIPWLQMEWKVCTNNKLCLLRIAMLYFSSVAQPNPLKGMRIHTAYECCGYIGSHLFCLQGLHSCNPCSFLLDNSQKQIHVPCFNLN